MKKLSPQSWTCPCGHVEKGEASEEKKKEKDKEELWTGFRGRSKGKIIGEEALSHRRVRVYKKKRTSIRG